MNSVIAVADEFTTLRRRLFPHFQRNGNGSFGGITVTVAGFELQLELVGRSFPILNPELFILFHGPVAVLVQRGGEKNIARLLPFTTQRSREDGIARGPLGHLKRSSVFLAVDGDSVALAGLMAENGILVTLSESVRAAFARHRARRNDERIVRLGDEVEALNDKIAALITILIGLVIDRGNHHLVETLGHHIRCFQRELARGTVTFNQYAGDQLTVPIEVDQRLFGYMIIRLSRSPSLAVIKRAEVDGHAISELATQIDDDSFTVSAVTGHAYFLIMCASIDSKAVVVHLFIRIILTIT